MKKTIALSMVAGALILSGCNIENGTGNENINPDHLAGSWVISSKTINPGVVISGQILTDVLPIVDLCSRDDIWTYFGSGRYETHEGETVCEPSHTESGTWAVIESQVIRTGDAGGSPDTFTVASITATHATFTQIVPGNRYEDNLPRTLTIVYDRL